MVKKRDRTKAESSMAHSCDESPPQARPDIPAHGIGVPLSRSTDVSVGYWGVDVLWYL